MNRQSKKFGILAAALLLTVPVAALAQSPNMQAVNMYNLGLTAYKQGTPESAIIFFKRAVDIDPNLADAQYNLGVIYQTQRRFKDAIPRFQEVLRIKPNDPDAHYLLGICYQETGRLAEAKQLFSGVAPNNAHFPECQSRISAISSQLAAMPGTAGGTDSLGLNQAPGQAVTQAAAGVPGLGVSSQQSGLSSGAPGAVNYQGGGQPAYPGAAAAQPPASSAYAPAQYSGSYQTSPPQISASVGAPAQTSLTPGAQAYLGGQVPQQGAYGTAGVQAAPQTASAYSQPYVQPGQAAAGHTQAPAQATTQAQPQPVSIPNPVPVLANTSCKVIANGFSAPAGLAFDRQGNMYVANFTSNSIDRISPDGSKTQFCSGANIKGPIGLAVDDSGNVYVANYQGGNVVRIIPAGVSTILATGFRKPYSLTLDRDGNLYVSQQEDNSIVRISLPRPIGARPQ